MACRGDDVTGLPGWLEVYVGLDDSTLAVLANPGLVRRGVAEVAAGRVALVSAEVDAASVGVGSPPMLVRLVAAGPQLARCPCPVAGVCVHIVAACVWARSVSDSTGAAEATVDSGESADPGGTPASVSDEALSWDPGVVTRAVGIAAVRRVAASLRSRSVDDLAQTTTVDETTTRLSLSWPGSPEVVFVRGTGVAGLLVAGDHSDVAESAWRLEAVVRLFALHGRLWPWPSGVGAPSGLLPGQAETCAAVIAAAESAVSAGLSHAGPWAAESVAALAQRARLEDLPLLAGLTDRAARTLARVASREDGADEDGALLALARAWALAYAVVGQPGVLPRDLVGHPASAPVDLGGTLIPLSARWWTDPSGARGLTVRFWDGEQGRVETVTAGRAAGVDPTFQRSAGAALIWNASADVILSAPCRVEAAERRRDGTLSPTTRSRVIPNGDWASVDLPALAGAVQRARTGPAAVGFGPPRPRVRLVIPRRRGIGPLEIDEVAQEVVWTVTDTDGVKHRLRLDAVGPELDGLAWVLAQRSTITALTVADGRPETIFVADGAGLRLVSPSLTTVSEFGLAARLRTRLQQLREHRAATPDPAPPNPLESLCADVREVLAALAASGQPHLSARQAATLAERSSTAHDLGLGVLARTVERLTSANALPADVLRAAFVLDRVHDLIP